MTAHEWKAVTPLPFDQVTGAVRRWLADRPEHFNPGQITAACGPIQWAAKGERFGNDAAGTLMLSEGGTLKQLLNFDWLGPVADDLYADFCDLLEAHGYWHELGHAWTCHLYPLEA